MTFSIFRAMSAWRLPVPKMDKRDEQPSSSQPQRATQIELPSVLLLGFNQLIKNSQLLVKL